MLRIPNAPLMAPIPFRELLATLDAWPSPDPWPFVPEGTNGIAMETPMTLLTFDRCEEFDDAEFEAFESWLSAQGLESFLNSDQLADIRDSLAHEIESLRDAGDRERALRHYDTILLRAIDHYNRNDAFVSLLDWVGAGGATFKGLLVEYP